MATRADKFTATAKKQEIFSDFLNSFEPNPFMGQLGRVTNEESIKQALKNLVLTNTGERFYDSNKGSKIRNSLFENFDSGMLDLVQLQLQSSIELYEPRCQILKVGVANSLDGNAYAINIVFAIKTFPGQAFNLNLSISRVR